MRIEQIAVPTPGRGDVLIKVIACGVCHSDLHAIDGDWRRCPTLPLIPGHEVARATSRALGEGVTDMKVGDAVGVPWMYTAPAADARFCMAGMETICKAGEASGYTKPGGYAEYMVAGAAFVARLPKNADLYQLAPILCAGVTTYRGLKRTNARPGQWMAVVGIGGLGHIAVQYAKAMGYRVAGRRRRGRQAAPRQEAGCGTRRQRPRKECATGAPGQDRRRPRRHRHRGRAAGVRAGDRHAAARRHGLLISASPGGKKDEIRASISAITNWELSVRGSNVGTRLDLNEAVAFAANGLVTAKIKKAPLEQINAIFDETCAPGRSWGVWF